MENKYDHIVGSTKLEYSIPHCALLPYIYSYTFAEGNDLVENSKILVISNGFIELFIHFDRSCICVLRNNQNYELSNYIVGLSNRAKPIEMGPGQNDGRFRGMIIRFTHKGVSRLMGINISDLSQCFVKCEEIWGLKGRQLYENVNNEPENRKKKKILDDFFLNIMVTGQKQDLVNLDIILKLCSEKGQKATVENVARNLCISYRTLSRKFEKEIGLCPKDYMKMIRFNRICQLISRSKRIDLPEILYYGGYYDQSHFIKEFKETLNITPAELLKNSHGNFYITRGMRID